MPGLIFNRKLTGTVGRVDSAGLGHRLEIAYPLLQGGGDRLIEVAGGQDSVGSSLIASTWQPSPNGRGSAISNDGVSTGKFSATLNRPIPVPGDFSYITWFYRKGIGSNGAGYGQAVDLAPIQIYSGSTTTSVYTDMRSNGTYYELRHTSAAMTSLTGWVYVAMCFDYASSTPIVYAGTLTQAPQLLVAGGVDYVLTPSATAVSNTIVYAGFLGNSIGSGGTGPWNGLNVPGYFWNRKLTTSEIAAVWADPYAPVTPPVTSVRYFLFNLPESASPIVGLVLLPQTGAIAASVTLGLTGAIAASVTINTTNVIAGKVTLG